MQTLMIEYTKKHKTNQLINKNVYLNKDHLGGVLSQLRNESNSLSEYLNLFAVTENFRKSGYPERVFNPDESESWYACKGDSSPQWIQIELKNIYLTITGYILMSYNKTPSYPQSWYLEGRNSENDAWQRIDERSGETELYGKKKVKKYLNNKLTQCTFKIFRLTQTERVNGNGINEIALNEMDFVGMTSLVLNPKRKRNICKTRVCYRDNSPLINFLLIALIYT